MSAARRVLAISGGVGGAKLAFGLAALLDPAELLIVANTGDDFEHLGLQICPDIDTLMYTLAGLADPARGWGLAGETWQCIEALGALGGPDWFRLGDRDLATHLQRSALLRAGLTLSEATARLAAALGVRHAIVPMSDAPVRTLVDTDRGSFAFQEYFVRERCEPRVRGVRFDNAGAARPAPALGDWLAASVRPVAVICPSNPWLSVDPVLAVPGLRERLADAARGRGVADRGRTRAQGAGGQDDGRARAAGLGARGGAPLPRARRCLRDRPRGPGPARCNRRTGHARAGDRYRDERCRQQAPARRGHSRAAGYPRRMIPPALWVLVPLKNLGRAKERLSGTLAALARRELVEAMARDVIEALQAVPVAPQRIVLVSDDDDVAALARGTAWRCSAPPLQRRIR